MNKLNNRILIIFFVLIIVATYWLYRESKMHGSISLSTLIGTQIDSSAIDRIEIIPGNKISPAIVLVKSEMQWELHGQTFQYHADQNAVNNLVDQLSELQIEKVIANTPDKFTLYAIDDSHGTMVKIWKNDTLLSQFFLSTGNDSDIRKHDRTYLRLTDKPIVFECRSTIALLCEQEFNSWRDKYIINDDPSNWSTIEFVYPADTGFVLTGKADDWYVNTKVIDKSIIRRTLYPLSVLVETNMSDTMEIPESPPPFHLSIHKKDLEVILVRAWPTENGNLLVHSSTNPGTCFNSLNNGSALKLLLRRSTFISTSE